MDAQQISLLLYNLSLIPVVFFSILFLVFAIINLSLRKEEKIFDKITEKYPFVSIQIPVYNDDIATTCVNRCLNFDYPKNKYEILIVDDSTNKKLISKLKEFKTKYPKRIKYIHRENRDGFKPGALQNALNYTKGEIIVVFDSDWKPQPNFSRKIVKPLEDKSVAVVQAKQAFSNKNTNIISRFASYLLMIYHSIIMPINSTVNSVFFCGTAGAIRTSILKEMGGWNSGSITEDADLSVRILTSGYKTVYLNIPVLSEVPYTIEGFLRQQMRWSYGLTRAFFDNARDIIFTKKLNLRQKALISYNTLGNIIAPFVIIMTLFGVLGWFLGEPELFNLYDILDLMMRFVYTSGFIILGLITLIKEKQLNEFPYLLLGTFSISIVLVTFNSYAFIKAILNQPLHWYRTPKAGNKLTTK